MFDNNLHLITGMFEHVMDFFVYFYNQGLSMFYFFATPIYQQDIPNDFEDILVTLGFTLEETPFEICFGPILFTVFAISIFRMITSIFPTP